MSRTTVAAAEPVRELYIYYRIDAADEREVIASVQRFQALLVAADPTLQARMLMRADDESSQRTCMETYATDASRRPRGIEDECRARIEAAASVLAPQLRSPRHIETFDLVHRP